jgi:hypothetical protein
MIYLVVGECGSYYCNGLHPLGVFEGEVDARLAAKRATDLDYPEGNTLRGEGYHPISAARVIEVPQDDIDLTDDSYSGCH